MDIITFYSENDKYFELSNLSMNGFEDQGKHWPSVEHYILAMELAPELHEKMRTARTTHKAKLIYNHKHGSVRTDWHEVRDEAMLHALRLKFAEPELQAKLLATEDAELVYAAPYDKHWGSGRDEAGANAVGKMLMQVRQELAVPA